jgi:hypothetical protein
MERAKEEREKENARLRRRVRYHENEVRTKEEKGEEAEVTKVPIEATETTSGRAGIPTATVGLPSPPPPHCQTVSSRHRCFGTTGGKGRNSRVQSLEIRGRSQALFLQIIKDL